jgi:hypothetical protein
VNLSLDLMRKYFGSDFASTVALLKLRTISPKFVVLAAFEGTPSFETISQLLDVFAYFTSIF